MSAQPGAGHRLCELAELEATGCREFRLGSGEWPMRGFVVRSPEGVRAYVNRCAHMTYPLNCVEHRFLDHSGEYIECFVHGALFERSTGYCLHGPCSGLSLAKIEIELRDGAVWLATGQDPEMLAQRYA
ncbi:MAG: Rieske 2Fe-2S domain-containing protein [Steroidobacteraceae bacterium]